MTAVVLGAGGAAGWAFHAGVVEGLAELGLPLQAASAVVATSAGAPVAASILAGASAQEIVSTLLRPPTDEEVAQFRSTLAAARQRWWSRLRPTAPGLVGQLGSGGSGVGVALAGLLPTGLFPTSPLRRAPGLEELGHDWPAGLWIPAVSLANGDRVVFGRDRLDVAVADAVEASQAVPVMFAPRTIDGVDYVDGATRSPTNADVLLAGAPMASIPQRVVLVAPMSRHPTAVMRRFARRRARQEVADLRTAGWDVVEVVPDDEAAEHLDGFPRRDPRLIPVVVEGGRRAIRAALG